MKEFDITIAETLKRTITVQATDRETAEAMVEAGWRNEEYVLNADDFKDVFFTTEAQREIQQQPKTMTALLVEPGKEPQVVELPNILADLQQAIGGHLECLTYGTEPVVILCNEEGKVNNLPPNRGITDYRGELVDIIHGNFIICGVDEDDFGALTPEQADKYGKQFAHPEKFYSLGGRIVPVKVTPQKAPKQHKPQER